MNAVPLVSVEQLSFQYRRAETPSLEDVTLALWPGELVLVAGPSGCGKSTLLRCLNGLIPNAYRGALSGRVMLAGVDSAGLTLADIARTVGSVQQDPERQIVASHVFEEVAFGLENQGLPVGEIRARTEATLRELNLWTLAERETFTLSGGEKQKLALAGVLVLAPQVLLLDEPLANLDPASATETLTICRQLTARGCTVILVEHRVEEVLRSDPDRVILMDNGRIIYNGDRFGIGSVADPRAVKLPAPLAMQRLIELDVPLPPLSAPPVARSDAPLLELRAVEFGYDQRTVLHAINLAIYPGDRIAVLGPNGSGKSTLLKHMLGLLRPQRGSIQLGGRSLAELTVAAAAQQVGYVFQNPSHMLFAPTVREEMAFGPRNLGHSEAAITAHTSEALALMALSGSEDRSPLTLSFGQQRRLCIASVIAMRAQILLLDEPTAGQDYRSFMAFMDGIEALGCFAAQVFITHDLDLALSYANRVLLFAEGTILADGPPHEVLAQPALLERCRLLPTSLLAENLRWLPHTGWFQRVEALAGITRNAQPDTRRHTG